jgi:hypothetical protein
MVDVTRYSTARPKFRAIFRRAAISSPRRSPHVVEKQDEVYNPRQPPN